MANEFNNAKTNSGPSKIDETYETTPLDMSDILLVCREYSQLGWQIQSQLDFMMEVGIEEAIESGMVKASVLPLIRAFLQSICGNELFGEASEQAYAGIMMLDNFEMKHPHLFVGEKN